MLVHATEEREGALLRRLKGATHGARPGRFGFVTGEESTKRREMVVVARVTLGPALIEEARALAEAGADGIEIAVRADGMPDYMRSQATTGDPAAQRQAVAGAIGEAIAAVEIPCGVFIAGGRADWSAVLDLAGFDWIHVSPEAPARLLSGKEVTRLITLAPDMPPGRLSGLPGLKADVVVVDTPAQAAPFTADALLALCATEAATQRPVLAGSGLGLTADDVAVLHDHGINGVLVTGGVEAVRPLVGAVEKL